MECVYAALVWIVALVGVPIVGDGKGVCPRPHAPTYGTCVQAHKILIATIMTLLSERYSYNIMLYYYTDLTLICVTSMAYAHNRPCVSYVAQRDY